jgi:hypothetical protein
MAERTGRRQRQHSPTSREASHQNQEQDNVPLAPESPGATVSPQHPGMVPDRSTVPGQFSTHVPPAPAPNPRRPLTEYGTAQRIMGVFAATPGDAADPSRFEQATAAYEEIRKALPAERPPERPAPGYALRRGDATASETQVVEAGPTGALPAIAPPAGQTTAGSPTGGDAPASVRSAADAVAGSGAVLDAKGADSGGSTARPGDQSSPAGTLPAADARTKSP